MKRARDVSRSTLWRRDQTSRNALRKTWGADYEEGLLRLARKDLTNEQKETILPPRKKPDILAPSTTSYMIDELHFSTEQFRFLRRNLPQTFPSEHIVRGQRTLENEGHPPIFYGDGYVGTWLKCRFRFCRLC